MERFKTRRARIESVKTLVIVFLLTVLGWVMVTGFSPEPSVTTKTVYIPTNAEVQGFFPASVELMELLNDGYTVQANFTTSTKGVEREVIWLTK